MELSTLRYFVCVAEEEHIGRAAERLHISASPLSRQIQKLEGQLGVALFERQRQRLRLTEAGRRFLDEARDLLVHAEAVRERGHALAAGSEGVLVVGTVPGALSDPVISSALAALRAHSPRVSMRLLPGRSVGLTDQVRRGTLDAAFVHNPESHRGIVCRLVSRRRFKLVLPESHPLAAQENFPPAALNGQPWVTLDRSLSPVFRQRFLDACRQAGFTPDIRFEITDLSSTLALVQAGLGCALVQETATLPPGVAERTLPSFPMVVELHAIWREGNAAAARFLDHLDAA